MKKNQDEEKNDLSIITVDYKIIDKDDTPIFLIKNKTHSQFLICYFLSLIMLIQMISYVTGIDVSLMRECFSGFLIVFMISTISIITGVKCIKYSKQVKDKYQTILLYFLTIPVCFVPLLSLIGIISIIIAMFR